MSLMMMLELEGQASALAVRNVLARCGVDELVEREDGFSGNFPSSNMYFFFESVSNGALQAEDAHVDWSVGGKMVFVYVISAFDECSRQLHDFLQLLSDVAPLGWILSFQYESICAVRDRSGLHWLRDF